jgi:hypothetical protein
MLENAKDWPIGKKGHETLTLEMYPDLWGAQLAIQRNGGGLVVITAEEALHLVEVLPLAVGELKAQGVYRG